MPKKVEPRDKEDGAAAILRHEPSWEDLAHDFDHISGPGEPYWVQWLAYEGHENFGLWLWRPHGPEADEARASFGLAAAKAIEKLGIRPSPAPTPTEYFPQWRLYCSSEEEFARKAGKEIDLSDSVPFGLGEEDRDAIDPCSRAWLELLRRNELGFKITAHGTDTIKGQKFHSLGGTIERVCSVSSLYCKRLARNEIRKRLMEGKETTTSPQRLEDTPDKSGMDENSRPSPKEFVDAAKRQPKRSYVKFAAKIGIGKDTLYAITKETRWVSDESYILVAQACKCRPEDLYPRDIPKPERRRG